MYSIVNRIWLCIFAIAKCIVTESVLLFISGMNLFKFVRDSTFNFLAEHIIIVLHTMTDSQLIRMAAAGITYLQPRWLNAVFG